LQRCLFAAHTVTVAVEVPGVAGVASADRIGSGGADGRAVLVNCRAEPVATCPALLPSQQPVRDRLNDRPAMMFGHQPVAAILLKTAAAPSN
jgi:hypothetical protein